MHKINDYLVFTDRPILKFSVSDTESKGQKQVLNQQQAIQTRALEPDWTRWCPSLTATINLLVYE